MHAVNGTTTKQLITSARRQSRAVVTIGMLEAEVNGDFMDVPVVLDPSRPDDTLTVPRKNPRTSRGPTAEQKAAVAALSKSLKVGEL